MRDRSTRRRPHWLSIRRTHPIRHGWVTRRSRDWELWTLRPALLVYVLVVQAAALGTTVVLLADQDIRPGDIGTMAGITALGVVKEEATRRVERLRRWYSDTPHQNMTSVWTFAAALVLPAGLAAGVVAVLYAHLWSRTWHPVRSVRVWKLLFSASAVTLSCHTATGLQQLSGSNALAEPSTWQRTALLLVAIVAYSVVNLGLVSGAIALLIPERSERTKRRLFGTLDDIVLEYATLALGAIAAIILLRSPSAVLLLIPVLLVLHRAVLTRQLEEAASTDAKTGLLNATSWRSLATTEADRAARDGTEFGILMLDLDHFKRINDTHGHLVGDQVLKAVADRLAAHVRDYDLLGRFGGEEFVAFCAEVSAADLAALGERLRSAVEQLTIPIDKTGDEVGGEAREQVVRPTISVGAAHYPQSGADLEELLLAADIALFAAKDTGRNQVQALQPWLRDPPGDPSDQDLPGDPSASA